MASDQRCSAFQGSVISRNAQRPNPPWLLTAGTQRSRAVVDLGVLVLLPLAGHLEDQVQQVVGAVAVVDADEEVGK